MDTFALLWLLAAPSEQACAQVLEGRVVDAATAEAIPRATVEVRANEGTQKTKSNDDGRFRLETLCAGAAKLTISRADYDAKVQTIAIDTGMSPVDITLEPRALDVLDDVVVIAPARKQLDAAGGDTLDGDALDRVRGRNLADALQGVAGVTVLRSTAGGLGKPIIRGQVGRRNVILYDRVRHESQKWGIDHAPELDPFAADTITVVKGAGALRYGSDAIGGVVLIDPPALPTEPGVSGETHFVGVTNGFRGTTATRLQGAHAKLPGFGWRLEGNVSRGAAAVTPDYPLDNTGSRLVNGGITLGYQHHGFGLQGSYRHHDMKAGIFSGLRNGTFEEFQQSFDGGRPTGAERFRRDYAIERPFQRVTHDLTMLRGRAPLGKAGDLVATYSFQHNDRSEYDVVRENVRGPQLEFDLRTHTVDLAFEQAPVSVGAALLEGSLGTSYQQQRNRYDGSDPAFLPDYDQDAGGVFAFERLVLDRIEFEGALRYDAMRRRSALDDRTFLPFRAQGRLPRDCQENAEGAICTTPFQAASGSLGLLFRPVQNIRELVLRFDAATAVRFPSTDEQFIKGTAPSFPVFANGDGSIGRERTWSGALTASYANDWIFAEASAFSSFIDEYIYFRAQPQSSDREASNYSECAPFACGIRGAAPLFSPTPVDTLFYGGEAQSTVRPPQWPVSFDGQASWVRARQLPSGAPLVFIPPDRYVFGLTYHSPKRGPFEQGFVGLRGTYVDRQRNFELEADFAAPPPGYFLLGAEAGAQIPFEGRVLALSIAGNNLTNTAYRDYTSLLRYFADEPGWEVLLRATLKFDLP